MEDKITLQRIELLHPKVREEVKQIYKEINQSLTSPNAFCRFAQGLRTIDEQNDLYAQGRTKPGKIVTNAKGGSSFHNYGLAIDIVMILDNKIASWDMVKDWDRDNTADWIEVVSIFKKYGWVWGGNFKSFKDYPHFERTFNYSWQELKRKYDNKDFIKGTKYVNI